ncbi:MAG: xylulokinase [Clostridiales bacterium]|jgi:xylulokinase|nr:xylulokinase [Clostridiales bacterium]
MKYLLGIDIGTSGTKVALYSLDATAVASKTIEYPLSQPKNGWAEQDPLDWWNAAAEGTRAVLAKSGADPKDIGGVGLSGQMHGLVMLDADGNPLRPSIIWCDQRTSEEVNDLNRLIGDRRIIEITANPPMTGFTAAKILWVKKNEPQIYEKCAHILLPKDYIRYKLTGEFATEASDASGMQLMDVPSRNWSDEVLSKLGIDRSLLGSMHESPDVTGQVHRQASLETGLAEGTIVVGGAGDNPAAAAGTGVVSESKAFTSLGSSAVVYAVSDKVSIDMKGRVHTLCASVPGKWTFMSCTQGAGLSLQWLKTNVCVPEINEAAEKNIDVYKLMDSLAADVPIGADKLLFLPYLMGERSPHPDPFCRGVFFGLSAKHKRENLIRAVLEGVAYSQRECVDVFREMGVQINDMIVTGGGGRSRLWRQMLADLYNAPVSVLASDEGPALGVALLAGVGAGAYSSIEEACSAVIKKEKAISPNPEASLAYEPYYRLYSKLYLSMKDDFKALASI